MMGISLRMDGIAVENDAQGGLDTLSRGYIYCSQLAFFGVIRLMKYQPVTFGIVREDVAVPAPIQRRFDLPLYFDVGELLLQEVAEELQRQRVVGLAVRKAVPGYRHGLCVRSRKSRRDRAAAVSQFHSSGGGRGLGSGGATGSRAEE